jgi:hypothetical protein
VADQKMVKSICFELLFVKVYEGQKDLNLELIMDFIFHKMFINRS